MNAFDNLAIGFYVGLALVLLVGFILPVAGIVVGVILARRKSQPLWYILSAAGAVALLVSMAYFYF